MKKILLPTPAIIHCGGIFGRKFRSFLLPSFYGGFIPLIYPPFIGILTVVGYLISRLITKKYNWIISIIGIVYILHFAIDFNLSYA